MLYNNESISTLAPHLTIDCDRTRNSASLLPIFARQTDSMIQSSWRSHGQTTSTRGRSENLRSHVLLIAIQNPLYFSLWPGGLTPQCRVRSAKCRLGAEHGLTLQAAGPCLGTAPALRAHTPRQRPHLGTEVAGRDDEEIQHLRRFSR